MAVDPKTGEVTGPVFRSVSEEVVLRRLVRAARIAQLVIWGIALVLTIVLAITSPALILVGILIVLWVRRGAPVNRKAG